MKCQMSKTQAQALLNLIDLKIAVAVKAAHGTVDPSADAMVEKATENFLELYIHRGPASDDGAGSSTDWVRKMGDPDIHGSDDKVAQ